MKFQRFLKNTTWILLILSALYIIYLSACVSKPIKTISPTQLIPDQEYYSQQYSLPVISLCYSSDTNSVVNVFGESGQLALWDLDSKQITTVHDLALTYTPTLRFSEDCQKITSAVDIETRTGRHGIKFDYFDKVMIWDLISGKPDHCIGDCENEQKYPTQIGYIFNEKTGAEIRYFETSYTLSRNKPWYMDNTEFIRGGDESEPTIAQIEFISQNDQFVIAYLEGGISIENRFSLFPHYWVEKNSPDEKRIVSGLIVSPTGKNLARIIDGELSVYKISFWGSRKLFSTMVNEQDKIVFSTSGNYFIVYGVGGASLWDLKRLTNTHVINIPNLTSGVVSSDGQMIFLGDKAGKIYRIRMESDIQAELGG